MVERGVIGILSPVEASIEAKEPAWYLNHRIVEQPDKSSSKLRLVCDSVAPYIGICVNDALEKGPHYSNSLFRSFLRWRTSYVAISGDTAKMFNQIALTERDQCYHRFLWRFGDLQSEPLIFQLLTVLFGDKPSPDLAGFSIKLLADIHKDYCPIGSKVLVTDTYIDDVGHSTADSTTANRIIGEVDKILEGGKFSIKVWNSDSPDVDCYPEEKILDVLGHCWNKESDSISMKLRELTFDMEDGLTKRIALNLVSRLWDPFIYLLLVTIKYCTDLQRIWQDGYGWDQTLPINLIEEWGQNMEEIQILKKINTDRCLKPKRVTGPPQLHAFSDGGEDAYGSCVFIRWLTVCGIEIRFVAAKAFVRPVATMRQIGSCLT